MSEIVEMWLNTTCGSERSRKTYSYEINKFFEHLQVHPETIVETWKQVKYDLRLRDEFVEEWESNISAFAYNKGKDLAPKSRLRMMATLTSFFKSLKIPVGPKPQKHGNFVKFHNRDITKAEVKRVLENAELRDKTFFLMMVESGLRPETLSALQFKHVKEDFNANRIPMKIDLPSELLKDRVEARWTFLGEDGYNALKEYLAPRNPLKDDDYIFVQKRKYYHDRLLTEHTTPNAFSVAFTTIAEKLGLNPKTPKGTPHGMKKQIRLYCLRKFFNNNIKSDRAYVEYWMGHTETQTYYVAKDVERHREEYAKGYDNLRIYTPDKQLTDLDQRLKEKETQLSLLTARIQKLEPLLKLVEMIGIEDEQTMAKFVEEIKKAKTAAITLGE